jgi:hypothetical protein
MDKALDLEKGRFRCGNVETLQRNAKTRKIRGEKKVDEEFDQEIKTEMSGIAKPCNECLPYTSEAPSNYGGACYESLKTAAR